MRILNRPMFRYGGPIREGVMHGMRNNYRSGQLVRPGPGRPGYQGKIPKTKTQLGAWLATKLPWWSKIQTGTKDIIPKTIKKIRGSQPFENMQGVFTQTGKGSGITSSPAATTFIKNLKDFKPPTWLTKYPMKGIRKYKQMFKESPKATATGTVLSGGALTSDPALEAYKNIKPIGKWMAEAALPGWAERKLLPWKKGPDEGDKNLKPFHPSQGNVEKVIEEPVIDPGAAARLAKQKQNERLQSYLDMMGYDRSKKTALSDALIDASALVQDATTEAGSLKHADWGNLINKAIQTTSKRLDKPEQIREAVGLMMTKGEIEKDIAAGKGTPLDIQERYYTSKLGKDGAERKMLGKPTSFIEALNKTKATDTKGDRTNQALMDYFDGYLTPTFKGKISKKKIDALGGNEVLKEGMSIGLDNGVYQISNSYIIVQGNKIIELSDVFGED